MTLRTMTRKHPRSSTGRLTRAALLAACAVGLAIAPVSADSAEWRARTADCGAAGTRTFLLPPSAFTTAIVPFHDAGSNAVLVPLIVTTDGATILSKPLAVSGDAPLVTCTYVDPAGRTVSITGLLTPG